MRSFWASALACILFAAAGLAQNNQVGQRDVAWTNLAGAGSPVLDARVHYPSVAAGVGVPLLPSPSGTYPVVVFLHGFGLLGDDYTRIGEALAGFGFIAVMLNTAQFDYFVLEQDARAVFLNLEDENIRPGSFFEGVIDSDRVGLLGHSMGGAVLAYVLNEDAGQGMTNPGYKCGLGLAPVDPALANAGSVVNVPIGLVSGMLDTLTPPAGHAIPYYAALDPTQGLKFHYQMGFNADHMNVAGLLTLRGGVFSRSAKIMTGFFGQFLKDGEIGLDAVIGPDGLADNNLVQLDMDASVPQTWADGPMRIGRQTRVSVAAEDGFAGLIAASATSQPIPTFIGPLLLDPTTAYLIVETYIVGERLDVTITVPNVPSLIGTTLAVQGAGATVRDPIRLGSALSFTIRP